jgi:hypothetical protein
MRTLAVLSVLRPVPAEAITDHETDVSQPVQPRAELQSERFQD